MRRAVVVGVLVAALLAVSVPALADDLDDLLERASEADFSGTKLVHCETPDGTVSQITDMKQANRVAVIDSRSQDARVVTRPGEFGDQAGDYSRVATVAFGTEYGRGEQYTVDVQGPGLELGRRVTLVWIMKDDVKRAVLNFDAATGAALRWETYNGDGSVYCTSEFLAFSPETPTIDEQLVDPELTSLESYVGELDASRFPDTLAGFTRVDVYAGSSETTIAFYTDGFFSASVVASDLTIEIPEMKDVEADVDGYRWKFFPAQAVVSWETPDGGYVLLGNAPLDILRAMLGELPDPGEPFFLARWWRFFAGQ